MQNPVDAASDLKKLVEGEVLEKDWQRSMYASDSSLYEISPLCIVIPKSESDVVAVMKYAYEKRIPVTARGGGTSLAGQSIGDGIVIDFSKYMNNVLKISVEDDYVVVEPGLLKSELDRRLKSLNKFFPPDPSSSDFCTIGGMIANNSGGAHTVKYGSTVDYILSLKVVLCNGEIIETRPLKIGGDEWRKITGNDTLESKIYREVSVLVEENQTLIREAMPLVKKNCSGYRLDELLQDGSGTFDLGRIFAASEGTLGLILQAKIRIRDIPRFRGTAMLQFDSLEKMGRALKKVLEMKPSAVELIDRYVVDIASASEPELKAEIPDYVQAVLLVEFDGAGRGEVEDCVKMLERELKKSKLVSNAGFAYTPVEAEKFWSIRKKSLPYVMKLRVGEKEATPFIEDVVIPPSRIPEYLQRLYDIYRRHDVEGVVYGHAGDGNLHTRPLLNMKDERDIETMVKIADEVFTVVREYRGSMTGEHGDGLVRGRYLESMFGREVYTIFRRVKSVFDPVNVLNPSKKMVDDPSVMVQNLRYGASYRRRQVKTALNWELHESRLLERLTGYSDEFSYGREVELCHGCGTCRELYSVRMCPVFKAYRDEVDSCRGRISVLRWLLKADGLPSEFELTDEFRDIVYNHCVQCKMCQVDCPSNVNVAKLMAEARARYSLHKGAPKGYGYFADVDRYGSMLSSLAPLSNRLLRNAVFRTVMEWTTGIDSRRMFPRFSRKTFAARFREYKAGRKQFEKSLVFFYDTYINYNNPDLGISIVKIFEKNGFNVEVPRQKSSGITAILEGDPAVGRRAAEYNVTNLMPYVENGVPIVTFSPSSGVALKMDYLNVLDTPAARAVSQSTFDIHEFLYSLHRKGELVEDFRPVEKNIYLHLHCHDIVQGIEDDITGLLGLIPSLRFTRLEKGCCGIGGAFGFVKDGYSRSLKIGEPLIEAVRTSDREVYSTGESCALQMEADSGRRVRFTVDIIREAYGL